MNVRLRHLLAALVGIGMVQGAFGQEPARLGVEPGRILPPRIEVSDNQKTANTIAEHLRQSGQLHGYTIDILFQNGTAELSGRVGDQCQREEALRIVQGVPGVERVRDHLVLASAGPITRTQAPLPDLAAQDTAPMPRRATEGNGDGGMAEPLPIFQAPYPGTDLNAPRMPPYAWPSYAPYNNFSRVAYPQAYPYWSWPYIGPFYPFPKVPPGWRSVKLEWQDGHWWFSKTATKHDWWRLRYW